MSTQLGVRAEDEAAEWLARKGHHIVARNWKRRTAEIDIVSVHGDTTFFIEVKYRSSLGNGSGFDYITHLKLRQMRYAAELYLNTVGNLTMQVQLAAIEVVGPAYEIAGFIEVE